MNKQLLKLLTTCRFCKQDYLDERLCQKCRKRDVHHGKKALKGKCQQCLEELPLVKEWNDKYYCKDCKNWNDEASEEAISTYCKRFWESWCGDCGKCESCKSRKGLKDYSARDLMIEAMTRDNFEALLSWEDDGFKQRYGEIMWELDQVKGLSPKNEDVFQKKISQRKFSRGT